MPNPQTPDKPRKKPGTKPGDNWKLTDEVIRKLEQAAAIDATVEEMCFYADISRDSYYRWIKLDPKLSDKIMRLRENPVLTARQTVVKAIKTDPKAAMEYLKATKRNEFASKTEVEQTGETAVTITYVYPPDNNQTVPEATSGVGDASEQDNN